MSRNKGNFEYNYPRVIKYLKKNGYEYTEHNFGQHIKIMGDTQMIELWPSRMIYHVLESEGPVRDRDYPRLSFWFDEAELNNLLKG